MSSGSTADHEDLVRALERYEIADARAKFEMVPSVHALAIKRLIQLRTAALPCGWDEMAESLEDFAKRRVEAFLRMQGPIHSHQPEVGVPGEPARYDLNRFGMWRTPFAYLRSGIAMATWLGEAPGGSAVWWNQKAKAYAAAPINEVLGFWVHMTDWEVEGLYPAEKASAASSSDEPPRCPDLRFETRDQDHRDMPCRDTGRRGAMGETSAGGIVAE